MIRKNTNVEPDELTIAGVYTAYSQNILDKTLIVGVIKKKIIQYMVEENPVGDMKVFKRTKENSETSWTEWQEYVPKA